jgi:hypothetical protein
MTSTISSIKPIQLAQAVETESNKLEEVGGYEISIPRNVSDSLGQILNKSKQESQLDHRKKDFGDLREYAEYNLKEQEISTRKAFLSTATQDAAKLKALYISCRADSLQIYKEIKKSIPNIDKIIDPKIWGFQGNTVSESVSQNYVSGLKLDAYDSAGDYDRAKTTQNIEGLALSTFEKKDYQDIADSDSNRFLLLIYLVSINRTEGLLSSANYNVMIHDRLKTQKWNQKVEANWLARNAAIRFLFELSRLMYPKHPNILKDISEGIIKSSDLGDNAVGSGNFKEAIGHYNASISKTKEMGIFPISGIPIIGFKIETLEKKVAYATALEELKNKQIELAALRSNLQKMPWSKATPEGKDMSQLFEKTTDGNDILKKAKESVQAKDEATANGILGTAQKNMSTLEGNLIKLKEYQERISQSRAQQVESNQLSQKLDAMLIDSQTQTAEKEKKEEDAAEAINNSNVPEAEKSVLLGKLAWIIEVRKALGEVDEMGRRLAGMPNKDSLLKAWEKQTFELKQHKKNPDRFRAKLKEMRSFATNNGDLANYLYGEAQKSYNEAAKTEKSNPAAARVHLSKAKENLDKALAEKTGDPKIDEMLKKVEELDLAIFKNSKTLDEKISKVRDVLTNFKMSTNRKEDFAKLGNGFVGLAMALKNSHPQMINNIVSQQSGESALNEAYLNCLFDPTNTGFYKKAYEKLTLPANNAIVLDQPGAGYSVAELTTLLKALPETDPTVEKLNDLALELSEFLMNPVAGDAHALTVTKNSPSANRYMAQRLIYGVSDFWLPGTASSTSYAEKAMRIETIIKSYLGADKLAEIKKKFGEFQKFESPAQVIAVYLMALDPAVQAGGVFGIFKNEWPNEGRSKPRVTKYLKNTVEAESINPLYQEQIEKLKGYYDDINKTEKNADRTLQIGILDLISQEAP